MASLDQSTLEAVNNANFKTLAEANAILVNRYLADGVEHANRVRAITEAHLAQACKSILGATVDANDATAQVKQFTGNDLGATVAQLGAAVAGLQQILKGAQTTPPETGKAA